MRKVMFKKYIKPEIEFGNNPQDMRAKAGTGVFQKDFSSAGYFHQWGFDIAESQGEGIVHFAQYTIGLVEDSEGVIHKVVPEHIKFVEAPVNPLEYYIGHLTTGEAVVMPFTNERKPDQEFGKDYTNHDVKTIFD